MKQSLVRESFVDEDDDDDDEVQMALLDSWLMMMMMIRQTDRSTDHQPTAHSLTD